MSSLASPGEPPRAPLPLPDPMPSDGMVALRAWQPGDVEFITRVCADDHVQRFISNLPSPYTVEVAAAWIADQEARRAEREGLDLAICDPVSGAPFGAVGIADIDHVHRRAEFGYWTAPEARRRGVARHGAPLMARWAFASLGVDRLQIFIEPVNMGSIRVAEAIGAKQEGLLRDHSLIAGLRRDVLVYGLLPDDLV